MRLGIENKSKIILRFSRLSLYLCEIKTKPMEKRIILGMLFAMTFVLSATAQDAMSVIRKHYTETQQKIEAIEKEEIPQEYYEVKILQNLPGTGQHQEVMRLYYNVKDNEDWQPDEPMLTRDLHFVTWKYNYAAREFYEEYLYDDKGNIEFVYNRNADLDEVGGELRLYYKDGKLFKVLVSNLNPETEKYEQTYSGSKMPEKYANALESINYKVGRWKRLFDELDGDTFH